MFPQYITFFWHTIGFVQLEGNKTQKKLKLQGNFGKCASILQKPNYRPDSHPAISHIFLLRVKRTFMKISLQFYSILTVLPVLMICRSTCSRTFKFRLKWQRIINGDDWANKVSHAFFSLGWEGRSGWKFFAAIGIMRHGYGSSPRPVKNEVFCHGKFSQYYYR